MCAAQQFLQKGAVVTRQGRVSSPNAGEEGGRLLG